MAHFVYPLCLFYGRIVSFIGRLVKIRGWGLGIGGWGAASVRSCVCGGGETEHPADAQVGHLPFRRPVATM